MDSLATHDVKSSNHHSYNRNRQPDWKIDHTIPIFLLFAIFIQTAGAFWWASAVTQRVDYLENAIAHLVPIQSQMVKLQDEADNLKYTTDRIERILERQYGPLPNTK